MKNWKSLCYTIMLALTLGMSGMSYGAAGLKPTLKTTKSHTVVWIDVRTKKEHQQDSIAGDLNIPYDVIARRAAQLFPDKSTEIHVYCRSGNRAGKALVALENAGYTHVINAGGINDAREERGLAK